jgi:transmembrane sensor
VVAAVCAACVLVIAAVGMNRKPPTSFAVGQPPVPGAVGEWVAADGVEPVPVRFSDGSALSLEPGTRMRVTETMADGAVVLVERGLLHAEIRHASPKTAWTLRAGPFSVQVTGTRFDAGWEPGTETLDVLVQQGSVVVNGPMLPRDRPVVDGEHLVVSVRSGRMALSKGSAEPVLAADDPAAAAGGAAGTNKPALSPTSSDEASARATAAVSAAVDAGAPATPATSATGSGASTGVDAGAAEPSWRTLATARKYKEAWAEIEKSGFDQEMARASAGELLSLSDVARFAGEGARAQQALLALRRRYGARGYSAFQLGRIAIDQLGSSSEAVHWFETYLQEEPSGALAEQAMGRIVDIQRRGSREAARAAAERYLARYPNGAYAAVARSVLNP